MKKILLLLLFPICVNAQDKITFLDGKTYDVQITKEDNFYFHFYVLSDSTKTIKKVPKDKILNYVYNQRKGMSAGDHLIKARDYRIGGIIVSFAGGALGIALIREAPNVGTVVFGGSLLAGFILEIAGIVHIGKAGMKLNEQNTTALYLQPVNNGVGLAYRF